MITVTLFRNAQQQCWGFQIEGHAGYADAGEDEEYLYKADSLLQRKVPVEEDVDEGKHGAHHCDDEEKPGVHLHAVRRSRVGLPLYREAEAGEVIGIVQGLHLAEREE